ncbi:MAG: prepilin-type N-terminal cleavage/methylation domain-containing protein [Candidatus Omnitrophica bacterium]|nr:prepilin-type N-terminal cleavage/methylation domain-containing protein [Candidatus Omnitrophota bacterium]
MYLSKRRAGFTLIELMIVITIISILIGLILTGLFQGQVQAVKINVSNNLRQCAIGIYAYSRDHAGQCPGSWDELTGGSAPYLDTVKVTKNITGDDFVLDCAGDNMYKMELSEPLASDVNGAKPTNLYVYGDGHVGR